ncbi:hypothetical protein EDD17DRAFT_1750690 [Pisolithus thermaeus]|nr:hypothetical protein EDD17DRAFT_1750690 [Pisolithus thermaeus]
MRNPYAYPAPFSREVIRSAINLTWSSAIANALSANPHYPIYLTGPRINNPAYPYPARNALNPDTYPSYSPLLTKRGKQEKDMKGFQRISNILASYRTLPQLHSPDDYRVGGQFLPIQLQRRESDVPFAIKELLCISDTPDLVGGNDKVFEGHSECVIEIRVSRPGYERHAMEKRIPTGGGTLTRSVLLVMLVTQIIEFARYVCGNNIPIESGQEQWAMECNHEPRFTFGENCVIIALRHCGGSHWQPEILSKMNSQRRNAYHHGHIRAHPYKCVLSLPLSMMATTLNVLV